MHKFKDRVRTCLVGAEAAIYRLLRLFTPVDPKTVVFASEAGAGYTGSPRAIYEKMVDLKLDQQFSCVWLFRGGCVPADLPGRARTVRYEWPAFFHYMARAGVWVFDSRQPHYLRKKKKQFYIQTWHGTPLKKLALDMDTVNMAGCRNADLYHRQFAADASVWDCLIAQNGFSADTFRRCFAFDGELLRVGYPRNDILHRPLKQNYIEALRRKYGLPAGKKVLLYAPTWRDNEFGSSGKYTFEGHLDTALLQEKLGSDYVLMIKNHYLVSDTDGAQAGKGFVFRAGANSEINELYLLADALITDYSSAMFDYTILGRPVYYYCYDLEEYRDRLRGFYFDLKAKAPGPIASDSAELARLILKYGTSVPEEYREAYRDFCTEFHEYETGRASDKVIRRILAASGGVK